MKKYLGEMRIACKKSQKEYAIEFLSMYSYIDGAHHKQWLIDQVARILMGTFVKVVEASWDDGSKELRYSTGEPSKKYLDWIGDDFDNDDATGSPP
jgi:hypothetical protein